MLTASAPTKLGTALITLVLVAGCIPSQTTPVATVPTEVEKELCIQWRDSLPTRSRSDTERTQQEIGYAYDVQGMVCPQWARFPSP